MLPIENACCFTGHRPKYFHFGTNEQHPDCLRIRAFLREQCKYLIGEGVTHFISGGAIGVDTWAIEEVIALRENHPHIILWCVLPYAGMVERFAPQDRERYERLSSHLQMVTVLNEYYHHGCMQQHNTFMCARSLYTIAVWTGKKSGTANTVNYANQRGRKVFLYNVTGK